jgi:hypothetical protein
MARASEWQEEIRQALRPEHWSLKGPHSIVKVLPSSSAVATALGGYITLGRFLVGKNAFQIEQDLGLKPGYLATGATVYRFTRLPMISEYEYELTTRYPGGLAYNPAHYDPDYRPGSRAIHQWQIKNGVLLPVDATSALRLKPGDRFPYDWLNT